MTSLCFFSKLYILYFCQTCWFSLAKVTHLEISNARESCPLICNLASCLFSGLGQKVARFFVKGSHKWPQANLLMETLFLSETQKPGLYCLHYLQYQSPSLELVFQTGSRHLQCSQPSTTFLEPKFSLPNSSKKWSHCFHSNNFPSGYQLGNLVTYLLLC